jgi:hypothetical protein
MAFLVSIGAFFVVGVVPALIVLAVYRRCKEARALVKEASVDREQIGPVRSGGWKRERAPVT